MTLVRLATLQDLPGAYRVCLLTGDSGNDGTGLYANPDLLGHVYVGAYLVGEPRLAYVVSDREGVAGYCLAVEDSLQFQAWTQENWWPTLREQFPLPQPGSSGVTENDEALIRNIHDPEQAPEEVLAGYPAHLHIDLLPRAKGRGLGRELIELVIGALKARGVSGVHLGVGPENASALSFYRHLGFTTLREEAEVIYLGMRFQ